ncbi:MAG: GNAT family N-acetyltransferase [Alphaproteobacteria bacterium]|nr:GNAT family N-acetyltransferase [Alphaproteobacteria bacterium]
MPPPDDPAIALTAVHVHRLVDVPNYQQLISAIEAVFFASSHTQTFSSDGERDAFRSRWLGRFLEHDLESTYVALLGGPDNGSARVIGYLVGCLDDPATLSRFNDLAYFQTFREQTARFPAQLHVNIDAQARNHGIGTRLIGAFVEDAKKAGCSGAHVVTTRGMQNVAFYQRNGFAEVAAAPWNGRELLFLGRIL